MKKLLLIILMLLLAGQAFGATYYVSPSGDNSNGETWATAYNLPTTLIATNKATPPHDVYIAPGPTYYNQDLTLSNAAWVGVQFYGTSAHGSTTPAAKGQVVISGSADTTAWSYTDQGDGVFSMSSPASVSVLPNAIWYGTTLLTADGVGAPPTPVSGHWGYTGAGPYVLYINVNGTDSPPVDGTLKVPQKNYPVLTGRDGQGFHNISFESANTTVGGVIYVNQNAGIEVDTCVLGYSALHFIYADLSTENDSLVVEGSWFEGGAKLSANASAIRVKGGGANSSYTVTNNIINAPVNIGLSCTTAKPIVADIHGNSITGMVVTGTTAIGLDLSIGDGWLAYDNDIFNIGDRNATNVFGIRIQSNNNIVYGGSIIGIRGCGLAVSGDSNVIGGSGDKNISISKCGYMGAGLYPYTYPDDLIKYGAGASGKALYLIGNASANDISGLKLFNNTDGLGIQITGGTGGNNIYNILAYRNLINDVGVYADSNPANRNIFDNITIYHEPSVNNNPAYTGHGFHVQDISSGGGKIFATNINCYNAVDSANSHCFYVMDNGGIDSIWLNNNNWYAVSGDGVNTSVFGTAYTDLVIYKAAIQGNAKCAGIDGVQASAEARSLFSDPLFFDVVTNDYRLKRGSPCINAGADVGLTEDFRGRAVPKNGKPDIGAYESWKKIILIGDLFIPRFADKQIPVTYDYLVSGAGDYIVMNTGGKIILNP